MKYWGYRVESQSVTLWHVWPHTARKSMSGVPRLQLWVSTYITDPWIPCLSSGIAASQSAFSKASALSEALKNYLLFFLVLAPFWNERWHSTYFGICDNSFNYYQSLTHISQYDYSPPPLKTDENNFTGPAWFMDTTISHTALSARILHPHCSLLI